jgi:hypothetical protein
VNLVYNHTDEAVICQGETYVFGTQNLITAGEYTEVFESVTGCDSTVVLTLTVNPVYNHADDVAICQGETYVFGTQNLTTAGEYTKVFESVTGCDSTVVLTLTVNPVYNHTDETIICQGETYVFGTQNLTTAGEYTEVFESVSGCDSTVVLTLTVNPVYNHTDEAAICQGETYAFGTQNLTTAGEFTELFESATGCDSTVVFTLKVNPVYNTTITTTVYSDELPFTFGSQALTEEGTYHESFLSVNSCDSLVTLTLVIKPADVTPPVLVCQSITVRLNNSGHYKLNTTDIQQLTAGTTDNETTYEDLTFQVVPGTFSCEMAGTTVPILITATDQRGNSSSANSSVMVTDQTPPEIFCKDTELLLDEDGLAELNVTDVYFSIHDACGILTVTAGKTSFDSSDLGNQGILVTATDKNNNKSTCIASVTVTDLLPPQFTPIENLVFTPEEGSCESTLDYPAIQVTDNCGVKDLSLIQGMGPDAVFPVGKSIERWVAVDASGNSDTISFEIMVMNNPAAPAMNKVADIEMPEDSEDFTFMLSNIDDGSLCAVYSLDFSLSFDKPDLLQSYRFSFHPGEDSAQLHLQPAKNVSGETRAIITVINPETGKQYSDTFNIHITPVNDPPIVIQPPGNVDINADDIWKTYFSPYAGIVFDDVDDEILQLSLKTAESDTLPGWISFINDSLMAAPTASDAGCITLILTAADSSGLTVDAPFSLCVSIPVGMEPIFNNWIEIYPNPTTGKLYINFSQPIKRITDVEVISSLGMKIFHQRITDEKRLEIDLGRYTNGMYILKATGGDICITHKILLKTTY